MLQMLERELGRDRRVTKTKSDETIFKEQSQWRI